MSLDEVTMDFITLFSAIPSKYISTILALIQLNQGSFQSPSTIWSAHLGKIQSQQQLKDLMIKSAPQLALVLVTVEEYHILF